MSTTLNCSSDKLILLRLNDSLLKFGINVVLIGAEFFEREEEDEEESWKLFKFIRGIERTVKKPNK